MHIKRRQWQIFAFFAAAFGALAAFTVAVWLADPVQLLRVKYPDLVQENMRIAAFRAPVKPGEGVYVGTSMLERSEGRELSFARFYNLSMYGASFASHAQVAEYFWRRGAKYAISSLDDNAVSEDLDKSGWEVIYGAKFSFYDAFLLYTSGISKYSCLFFPRKKCYGQAHDFRAAASEWGHQNFKEAKKSAKEFLKRPHEVAANARYADEFEREFLTRLRALPDAELVMVLPPYSSLYYLRAGKAYLRQIEEFFARFAGEKRLKIYAFEGDFMDDLGNYRLDAKHYQKDINSLINAAIEADFSGRAMPASAVKIREQNVEGFMQRLKTRVNNYAKTLESGGK